MSAEGQAHGASRVLGPVFIPAGGNDASVREEIQGPGVLEGTLRVPDTPSKEQFVEMARTAGGAVCSVGTKVWGSALSWSWLFSGHTEVRDI